MLNFIWVGMIFVGIVVGILTGKINEIADAILQSAKTSAATVLGLLGIYMFWMGILNIATEAGAVNKIAGKMERVLKFLFPEVPKKSPAMGYISLNIVANMLGMGNAATPFGLAAMKELSVLNNHSTRASNAMCMLLCINASSVQLLPLTVISLRSAFGSENPAQIVLPTLIATAIGTAAAIIIAKLMEKRG